MIPIYADALLRLLAGKEVRPLTEDAWADLLALADRAQCTLFLDRGLPDWVAQAVHKRRESNRRRRLRLLDEYLNISRALERAGIEFVLLKSFSHETGFGFAGENRVQYDIDLLCPEQQVSPACRAIESLGYQPHGGRELSAIHERPLVKPSDWSWKGDYFDAEMPIPVEIHHSLWSGAADRLALDTSGFWQRRTKIIFDGIELPVLCEADRVGFAALHVLKHVLHNNLRLSHAFELARVMEARTDAWWREWQQTPGERLRMFEAIAMRFSALWFGCGVPAVVRAEWGAFSPGVVRWFATSSFAPLENLFTPNKEIVWLHRELIEGVWDRMAIVASRLLPLKRPPDGRAQERFLYHARALRATVARSTASRASETSD